MQQENLDLGRDNSEAAEIRPDRTAEIVSMIRGSDTPRAMKNKLEDYHGSDIAEALEQLSENERKKLYRICTAERLAEIFEFSDEDTAGTYLDEMDLTKAAEVVASLETDTAANILHEIEKTKRGLIIELVRPDIRDEIRLIGSFDDDEIGSRMTTNYISITEGLSVKQAMNELVRQAEENDNISTIFVVGDDGEFYGAIDLKDLITARSTTPLDKLIMTSFPYVYAHEAVEDCIEVLKGYSENIIPVLDNKNKLLGVMTSQNVIEAADDEMGEDYARLAGLTAEEDLQEPLGESMKKRLPWLLALLGLGLVVSAVVGTFEKVIAGLPLIMAFQSLILDMAGNVGTQSLAVTIRVLIDENLTFGQKMKLVGKEMRVGLCNGLLLGILSFVMVGLYIMLLKGRDAVFSFAVSGCIGLSLILAMVISSSVGTIIPLFFKKIKVDPAVASGPLITTVNDLVAVVTYYGLSRILLINVMGLA